MKRLVVLVSGSGSNLQAILDACKSGKLAAKVVAVIANNADAYGLTRAENCNIPTAVVWPLAEQSRAEYDAKLAMLVQSYAPDVVVLAGWMRLLSMAFLTEFPMQVVNLHPALPGQYPGTQAIARAYDDYQKGVISHTGVMVHFVPDEGVDDGPVIDTVDVEIQPDDALADLETRIHQAEHTLLVSALQSLISE